MNVLADRMHAITDSITLAVSAKSAAMRRAGIDVVSFGAGEPDFDTPTFIKDSAKDALDRGITKYTPTPSVPELREAVAQKFNRENGLPYTSDQISIGAGGKHCMFMAFMAVLNDGDEVLLPAPYWVSYPHQIRFAGGVVKSLKGDESNSFKITPEELDRAITKRTKVFVINTPANPTGHAYAPDELKALAEVLVQHPQVMVFSDEIYEKLIYDGLSFVSFAALHPALLERTLTINCHSKTYAMTGWRVGYVGGPRHVIDAINRILSHMISHIPSFIQPAAAVALLDSRGPDSITKLREEFELRRNHMWERLSSLEKITCVRPQGAFYCFPNVSAYFGTKLENHNIHDATTFAAALLEHAHVAVVPGNDSGFDTHVRLSFATSMEQIDKGLERIGQFLGRLC